MQIRRLCVISGLVGWLVVDITDLDFLFVRGEMSLLWKSSYWLFENAFYKLPERRKVRASWSFFPYLAQVLLELVPSSASYGKSRRQPRRRIIAVSTLL